MTKPFFEKTKLESTSVQAPSLAFAKTRGWFAEAVQSKSRKGFPDAFLARNGEIILAEFKVENGEARVQQQLRHAQLRKAGVRVEVITSLDQAKEIFR